MKPTLPNGEPPLSGENTNGAGTRTLIRRSIEFLRDHKPDQFRALFADQEWMELALDAFRARLKAHERDAVRLYFEAMGWVGGRETTLILAFLGAHGVTNMDDAGRYLRLAKSADGATIEDARRTAVATLRGLMRADPSERKRLMQELFGLTEVAA